MNAELFIQNTSHPAVRPFHVSFEVATHLFLLIFARVAANEYNYSKLLLFFFFLFLLGAL